MKFYLDENFPKGARELLGRFGHEWQDHRGTNLEGLDDTALLLEAQQHNAIILTTDRDFFHAAISQVPGFVGVVIVALKQPNRASILRRLEWVLKNLPETAFRGRAIQLRDQTWIARPPLGDDPT